MKLAIATTGTKLFEIKPVRQWLWGYNDTLLELLKLSQPDMVPFTYFGWFMNKNNTDPGRLTIKTGVGKGVVVEGRFENANDDFVDLSLNLHSSTLDSR